METADMHHINAQERKLEQLCNAILVNNRKQLAEKRKYILKHIYLSCCCSPTEIVTNYCIDTEFLSNLFNNDKYIVM